MQSLTQPMLILIAGPYRSNTGDVPAKIAANLRRMNEAALDVFRRGHIPMTGEALALPLIELAGSCSLGDEIFNDIFHPLARRLIGRVDAVLRIEGVSRGADEMVDLARSAGLPVYSSVDDIARIGNIVEQTKSASLNPPSIL